MGEAMRVSALAVMTALSLAGGAAVAQQRPAAPPAAAAAPSAPAPKAAAATCPGNPNALGVSRTVEIDTTGGPGFGFEHFKAHDFLRMNEVVLTFDDGPWPQNTPAVLAALAAQCVKATFFPIGKHALWHPEILKQVAAAGHTVGSHTWSHQNLWKAKADDAKAEIEKGASAVRLALGSQAAPFFRFPALKHPPEMMTYLGERNIGVFSTDMDSFDFKMRQPDKMIEAVMAKLKKFGKGIVLMHDFQRVTAQALPDLLARLKADGYKIVHLKAKGTLQTVAEFDAVVAKEVQGAAAGGGRPTSSVVRTVDGD